MQRIRRIFVCLLLGAVFSGAAWAMDFAGMSNQELADLRGAIRNAPEPEQMAFQQEWEKRLAAMTEEEKKPFVPSQEQLPGEEEKMKKPYIPGRGYESQGIGTVIYGGEGSPGQDGGKKAGK